MKKTILILSLAVFIGTQLLLSPFVSVWPQKIAHGSVHDTHEIEAGSIEEVEAYLEQLSAPSSDFSIPSAEPSEEKILEDNASFDLHYLEEDELNPSKEWSDADFFGDDSNSEEDISNTKNKFAEPLEPALFYQARDLYNQSCTGCHPGFSPSKYTLEQWPALLSKMAPESGLNQEELHLIYRYIVTSQINPDLESQSPDETLESPPKESIIGLQEDSSSNVDHAESELFFPLTSP